MYVWTRDKNQKFSCSIYMKYEGQQIDHSHSVSKAAIMWIQFTAAVLFSLLATAHSQYYNGPRYNGPMHIPVIGPNGVPQEPPELVAARRNHLAAFNSVPQQQQQYNPQQQYQPQQYQAQDQAPVQPRYNGPWARIGPDGMPQYDQAVAQARAAHQAAYAEVNTRNANLHSQNAPYQQQWH